MLTEWVTIVTGSFLGPFLTWMVKKIPAVQTSGGEKLGAAINFGVCLILFIGVGAILPRAYPELPHDLQSWVQMGMAAAAAGNAGNNVYRKTRKKSISRPRRSK